VQHYAATGGITEELLILPPGAIQSCHLIRSCLDCQIPQSEAAWRLQSEKQAVRCGLPVNHELSGNLYLAMMATSAVRSPGTTLGFRHCASRTHVREEIKRRQLPIQSPVGRLLRGDQILSPVCCLLRLPPPTVEVVDPMSHKVDLKSVAGVYLFLAGRHPLIPLKE
jgi:hypothetical protein